MGLRIVGGELRGRRFGRPGTRTRPTSDRVREALASALQARGALQDAHVLDLYAGTGALAFEALSRGARAAVTVDADVAAMRDVERSATRLELAGRIRTLRLRLDGDPAAAAQRIAHATRIPFDLIFADPPYARIDALPPLLQAILDRGLVADRAYVVIEHAARGRIPPLPWLASEASYRYGDTGVALMRRDMDAAQARSGR